LRHQRNEFAAGRQITEVGEGVLLAHEDCADVKRFLVRQFEKVIEQAEFGHDVQRRGMNSVAAEIAEEIDVFFEHDDVDPGAGEQESEHEPARSAADHAATCGELFGCHGRPSVNCNDRTG
jgi:hypothetical protein